MKKRAIRLAGLLLGILPIVLQAQITINIVHPDEVLKAEPIEKELFTVQYQTAFVSDTLRPDRKIQEVMMLKVGTKSSVYYSYSRFHVDSLIEADKASGASNEVIQEHLKQNMGTISYQIYKNYPAGKVTTLDAIASSRFRCEEKNEQPEWQLWPDTLTILSYPCRKATCRFKGREYEAWYTPEIPRSEGPWKLQGLPGLILKANDIRNQYTFECTGIQKNTDGQMIQIRASGYEPISRKNLNKIYERYNADPMGYIASTSPNVTVIMTGEDGKPMKAPKNVPYNPIELSDK